MIRGKAFSSHHLPPSTTRSTSLLCCPNNERVISIHVARLGCRWAMPAGSCSPVAACSVSGAGEQR